MIPTQRAHLQVAAKSHPGMSGKNNEDRYAVSAYRLENHLSKPVPVLLAIVSDGIGGHRAGEIAAELAVETISQALSASDGQQPVQELTQAVIQAGQAIYLQSETEAQQRGMGATCACVWIIGSQLYTTTVGDSRIYLSHDGGIQQISTDHTWVQEAIEHGALTPEQARKHPNAHVIRRYLGSSQPVVPDTRLRLQQEESDLQAEANQGLSLQPGDQLLICSDGLTDLVEPDEILAALKGSSLEGAVDTLIDLANQRGGHDNITVVALEMPPTAAPGVLTAAGPRQRRFGWACLGVMTLVLIGALLAGGAFLYLTRPTPAPTPTPSLTATAPGIAPVGRTPTPATPSPTPFLFPTPTLPGGILTPPATSPATGLPTLRLPTLTPWPTNTLAPRQ